MKRKPPSKTILERLHTEEVELKRIRGPGEVVPLAVTVIGDLLSRKEVFLAFMLNTKNVVIKVCVVSIGTLNAAMVHPREILRAAIEVSAASIILAHNHPTGDPVASNEDVEFTKRFEKCGSLIGIQLLDHVIVGRVAGQDVIRHVSLAECGALSGQSYKISDGVDIVPEISRIRDGRLTYEVRNIDGQRLLVVHEWGRYERSSVLAGQARKSCIDTFEMDEEEVLKEKYPTAERSHPLLQEQNTFHHLEGPDDLD